MEASEGHAEESDLFLTWARALQGLALGIAGGQVCAAWATWQPLGSGGGKEPSVLEWV